MPSAIRSGFQLTSAPHIARRTISIVLGIIASTVVWGQATNTFPSSGNVGIGTTTPAYSLDVSSSSASTYLRAKSTSGEGALLLDGSTSNGFSRVWHLVNGTLEWTVGTRYGDGNYYILRESGTGNILLSPPTSGAGGGNVGIGTLSPQYPLSVNGTIQAKEVIVNTGWSDYVFDHDYHLRPLDEVGAYIKAHHHLPDIPSQAEVKEKGVSVGEMQSRLLAKIEELTLHMIREHEQNDRLERRNRELEERLARIEGRLGDRRGMK